VQAFLVIGPQWLDRPAPAAGQHGPRASFTTLGASPQIMARKQITLEGLVDATERRRGRERARGGEPHLRRPRTPAFVSPESHVPQVNAVTECGGCSVSFDPRIDEAAPDWLRLARVYLQWFGAAISACAFRREWSTRWRGPSSTGLRGGIAEARIWPG